MDGVGPKYPPALAKLRSIRDDDEWLVRAGKIDRKLFQDIAGINRESGELAKTRELFVLLDKNKSSLARDVYPLAERSLWMGRSIGSAGSI